MGKIDKIHICGLSDPGKTRQRNEDAFLIGNIIERTGLVDLKLDMRSTSLRQQAFLAAVADGMGGMGGGDVASMLGLQTIANNFYANDFSDASVEFVVDKLTDACMEAHRVLAEHTEKQNENKPMGTTVVGFCIVDEMFFRFHVGDSRLYRLRNEKMTQVTKDHSLVQMLLDTGKLKDEEVENFQRKNEITNSIGAGTNCQPEVVKLEPDEIRKGDLFLLCSDGLSNELDLSELPVENEALHQLFLQAGIKEKELDKIIKKLCKGDYHERLVNVLEGIDAALTLPRMLGDFNDICKSLSQIHSNWQGWRELLSIILAEMENNLLEEILKRPSHIEEKTRMLIDEANNRDSRDNVTAILINLT